MLDLTMMKRENYTYDFFTSKNIKICNKSMNQKPHSSLQSCMKRKTKKKTIWGCPYYKNKANFEAVL